RLMQVPPRPAFLLHLRATQTCAIGICHADLATADKLHKQIKDFKIPALDDLKIRPYSAMAELDEASGTKGAPSFSHLECLQDLSDPVLDGLVKIAKTHMPPLMIIELQQLGGALDKQRAEETSFTAPEAPFVLHLVSPTLNTTLEELAPITKEAFNSLGSVYTGEVLYNFLRANQQDRVRAAFGDEKYKCLQEIKRRFDPSNVFRLNLNILPD
ncbi:MAG: BBE domain-containing protein, partial [Akkermansiaceae bacterium]|nr:BBE domain-containing protein [Armatimonadota bacterium]